MSFRMLASTCTLALAATAATAAAQAATFDHSAYDRLLHQYVVGGLVDYDGFAHAPEFAGYLDSLAVFDPTSLPPDERLAFCINAYNAYTIQLINVHHERKSIREINKSFGFVKAYGPWKEKIAKVGGRAYGLDEIEQGIIRKQFHEPRIHFALVCAAMGCPPLRSEAYVGARLGQQLDDQARIFLTASPSKNRVDVAAKTVYLSPIFVSFRDYIKDFGGTDASVGRFVAQYYADGPEKQLLESGAFNTVATNYDWSLNSTQHAQRTQDPR